MATTDSPAQLKNSSMMIGRSQQHSPDRFGRSPTIEEQKSLNMAESLNMRAIEADG